MKPKAVPLSILLTFLLLFMQLGQALHTISHIEEGYNQPAGLNQKNTETHFSAIKFCDQCLSFAATASAATNKIDLSFLIPAETAKVARSYLLVVLQPIRYFKSRAPPSRYLI